MAERIPVLLDTDLGTNVDDALCLAYLLRQPRCELLGITTVTGEAAVRARLAGALCHAAGWGEIPLHSGAERPLLGEPRQARAEHAPLLRRLPAPEIRGADHAVDFLRETIRSRPGEVTLVAVGALTNVALLFCLDPDVPKLLRRLVWMGGCYRPGEPGSRWVDTNALNDPLAAAIVLERCPEETLLLGSDTTAKCRLSEREFRRRLGEAGEGLLGEMVDHWFRDHDEIRLHDPLAAGLVFEPGLVDCAPGRVEVELSASRVVGLTYWDEEAGGPHRVATGVDVERFFGHWFGTVTQS